MNLFNLLIKSFNNINYLFNYNPVLLLSSRNIGHSATCNGVGYILAQFLGYILFIILDSKDFCNKWFRTTAQSTGLISYSSGYTCD